MNFNFELILFYATLACGVVAFIDIIFLEKKRRHANPGIPPKDIKLPRLAEYGRSFFPILLFVFLVRSFLYEPFRIPTGSLEPTLQVGDFILVNKFDYGIRLPVIFKKIYPIHSPERGDIFIFRWPPNPSYVFIKRLIGLPGDRISYINKEIYINGEKMPQTAIKNIQDKSDAGALWDVLQKEENLSGIKHAIYQVPGKPSMDFHDMIVPEGMYFAMGDNRDDSADSRFFGFVPEENLLGKATLIWMSWDKETYRVRWGRLGKWIH